MDISTINFDRQPTATERLKFYMMLLDDKDKAIVNLTRELQEARTSRDSANICIEEISDIITRLYNYDSYYETLLEVYSVLKKYKVSK
jgi:hypothetical protein